jgi:enamine deaminase RidA (YjgF/YER057c/UK114 family)
MGSISDAQEIVDAVVFLAEAPHITGEVLYVDGGAHVGKMVDNKPIARRALIGISGTILVTLIGARTNAYDANERVGTHDGSLPASAEQRLKKLGITLPAPPEPFGTYVEAVQTSNLLFLSGMLPTEGHEARFIGRVGAELDVEAGRRAAFLAALNVLAVARQHLGSLDNVTRVVRLGVSVATAGDVREQPQVADAASELLQDVFGKDKSPCRLVFGVASLPLGTPVELEVIFEVAG